MKQAAILLAAMHVAVVYAQTRSSTTAITSAQTAPTQVEETDRNAAQHWGLTIEDYRRYQSLMKGVRGAISDPRISPIEVLGIHARDDAERRKYAELFARLMAEDTQRVLQVQLEYDRAFRRLHPKLVAFVTGPGTRRQEGLPSAHLPGPVPANAAAAAAPVAGGMSLPPSALAGDRILVFTRDDCRGCDDLVQRAFALAHRGVTVDLYVVGARSADDAQRYAQRIALDPALVGARRVTLNLDGGTLARVLPRQQELPALVRKRGESLMQLAASEL